MEFLDFILDLLGGASEVYFAKRDARKAEMRTEAADKTRQIHEHAEADKCAASGEKPADREKVKRSAGDKKG